MKTTAMLNIDKMSIEYVSDNINNTVIVTLKAIVKVSVETVIKYIGIQSIVLIYNWREIKK